MAETRPAGALPLSGDVHYAELIGDERGEGGGGLSGAASGAGVVEVTSSGLTHAGGERRVGWLLHQLIFWLFSGHRRGGSSKLAAAFPSRARHLPPSTSVRSPSIGPAPLVATAAMRSAKAMARRRRLRWSASTQSTAPKRCGTRFP